MIRPRFLTAEDRAALVDLAQPAWSKTSCARRANALVLLDDGLSCEMIAKVPFLSTTTRSAAGANFMLHAGSKA